MVKNEREWDPNSAALADLVPGASSIPAGRAD
jgi:hypothetical protein